MDALFEPLLWLYFALAPVTLVVLLFLTAPYGRHNRPGWGPQVPVRAGWLIMEIPTFLVFFPVYFMGAHRLSPVSLVLVGLWVLHYGYRTFLYPRRLETGGKRMPLLVALSGFGIQTLNSGLQAWWLGALGDYATAWLWDPRFVLGVALFGIGMVINHQSDNILLSLRAPGSSGYRIPAGASFATCRRELPRRDPEWAPLATRRCRASPSPCTHVEPPAPGPEQPPLVPRDLPRLPTRAPGALPRAVLRARPRDPRVEADCAGPPRGPPLGSALAWPSRTARTRSRPPAGRSRAPGVDGP